MKNSSTHIIGLLIAIVALQMPGLIFAPPTVQENLLGVAIVQGNPASVERLLAEGVNPNAKIGGDPLLFFAIRAFNPKIVALLLGKGANPHIKGLNGKSALEFAIEELNSLQGFISRTPSPLDLSRIANMREIVQKLQMISR